MKIQLLIFLSLLLSPVLQAQNVTIPDTAFKHYLLALPEINTNGDEEIQVAEAGAFAGEINVDYHDIADLSGIEAFINLTSLSCTQNRIDSLNLSQNSKLEALRCRSNGMDTLILGSLPALTSLSCYNNSLKGLDLSGVPRLSNLNSGHNDFTRLDLSQNTELSAVRLQDSKLHSLDMRNGNNLNISTFNVNNNPDLKCISVDDVSYSSVNWTDIDDWTSFSSDCSQTFDLQFVVNDGSHPVNSAFINFQGLLYLTDADGMAAIPSVSAGEYAYSVGAEGYTSSRGTLLVDGGHSETISLVAGTSDIVYIPDDQFRNALTSDVAINSNGDIDIQVAEAGSYTGELSVRSLDIEDMTGIEYFTSISILRCQNNQIRELDVSSNVGLVSLFCYYNTPLESLHLGSLPSLEYLECYSCQLKTLDFTQTPALTRVVANDNALYSVDLRNGYNEALTDRMDLTKNPGLNCVSVDNIAWADSMWTSIDEGVFYSLNCNGSDDASLKEVLLNDEPFTGFEAGICKYTVEVAPGTTGPPIVSATANDENAMVTIRQAESATDTVCIEVLSETGLNSMSYYISFTGLPNGVRKNKTAAFRVYPNPAKGILFFEGKQLPDKVTFYTLQGKQLLEEYPDEAGLDISQLEPGMYLVGFHQKGQVEYHKVLKH